jgi:hypothetical protein
LHGAHEELFGGIDVSHLDAPDPPTGPSSSPLFSQTHRLDRAIAAISVNPELGTEVPGTLLRDYVDEIDGVRVIYYVIALGSITIVARTSNWTGALLCHSEAGALAAQRCQWRRLPCRPCPRSR